MKKKIRVDLHNHTTRCNHAEGTIDEYIQKAIALGINIYGFSEHAPMDFDSHYRLNFDEMESYTNDILIAKEYHKEKIQILLGYEVDWLPGYMDERVLGAKVDYMIGSIHFLDQWGFDNPEFIGKWKNKNIDEIWKVYFEATENMAKSGKFDIVGHFDLIKIFKFMPKQDIRLLAKNALHAIKASNMVLEINTAGLRKPIEEMYPSRTLVEEAYALDILITFSSDAHDVAHIGAGYDLATSMAHAVGYTQAVTFKGRDKQLVTF